MKYFRKFEKEVDFHNSDLIYPTVSFTVDSDKVWVKEQDIIIMTSASNPEVMAICYNQGWAKNQDYMYKSEAEAVTDIGTAFNNGHYCSFTYENFIYSFDEFRYFTGVTRLQPNAFNNQRKLVSIKLPDSIYDLGEGALCGCEKLNELILPSGLMGIKNGALCGIKNIKTLNIPKKATNIYPNIFGNVMGYSTSPYILEHITVDDDNPSFTDLDCDVIVSKNSNEVEYGCGNSIIPPSVSGISDYAFYCCGNLTEIDIPSNIINIGIRAFYGCPSLTSVTIGNSVTSIGNETFGVCQNLTKITCLAETAPSITNNTFNGILNNNGVLIVPSGSDYSTWMAKLPSTWTISYLE